MLLLLSTDAYKRQGLTPTTLRHQGMPQLHGGLSPMHEPAGEANLG